MNSELITISVSVLISIGAGIGAAALFLGKYQQKIDTLEKRFESLDATLGVLKTDMVRCQTIIDERTSNSTARYIQRKSPVSLTPDGENILKKSGGDKYVLENLDQLIEDIRASEPATAYDVQEAAKTVIASHADDNNYKPLKDFAYKEGLDLGLINVVNAVYLRDLALPRLGYKPEDIDTSDPSNGKK